MDCCLSYARPRFPTPPARSLRHPASLGLRKQLIVVASASSTRKPEFGGLYAPLEPRTPAGRLLTGVLLDDRDNFQVAARKELERLANERDEAAARLRLSLGSDEACLHRRIAELKNHESQEEVEDVMYVLINHKFSEMRVHLIPRLSKCIYNSRLEIWPSKDWELESIHSLDVLELVREHLAALVGCPSISNVTQSWATTQITRLHLCKLYAASILYGYFLKSVSLRHRLERTLNTSNSQCAISSCNQHPVSELFSIGSEYIGPGRVSSPRTSPLGQVSFMGIKQENLRVYVMGFDQETIQMCAKPKSKEAMNVIERHSCALFGDEKTGLLEIDDVITTSFASVKRFLLEAVAFGSFLWDAENCVNGVYMLEEN